MRTKNIQLKIFTFDELSDEAKQRATDKYAELFGYHFADEAIASLNGLAEHFAGRVKDYSLDWFNSSPSSVKFDMPELEESDIAERLARLGSYNEETKRGNGDCVLTGYCSDEDAIDGFRQAWHAGERELTRLMQAAFKTWLESAQADCRDFYSNEQFSEHADANKYEFTESGTFYREGKNNLVPA